MKKFTSFLELRKKKLQIEETQRLSVIEKSAAAMLMLDWQSLSLLLAGVMCLLFFLVAAYIYWQHSRYWKKLEQMERGYNAGKLVFSSNLFFFFVFNLIS